jgi:hypothetical protein
MASPFNLCQSFANASPMPMLWITSALRKADSA